MTDLGIIGGGQLAQMLRDAALSCGISVTVLAASAEEPAALATASDGRPSPAFELRVGDPTDEGDLRLLLAGARAICFENEWIDTELLCRLLSDFPRTRFLPRLAAMHALQDKLRQKILLHGLALPTAPYFQVPTEKAAAANAMEERLASGAPGLVLKWAQGGYDGRGNFVLRDASAIPHAWDFAVQAQARGVATYAEDLVAFTRELALVSVRARGGQLVHYPMVISEQASGVCKWVRGPAIRLGVDRTLETEACRIARTLAERLDLVGAFALEFFEVQTSRGLSGLLVNEIAPRVHNTGHFSQDACRASQFENHVRAVVELPLVEPETAPYFAMLNLLGPAASEGGVDAHELRWSTAPSGTVLHNYGKARAFPGRKLGHVNARADSEAAFRERLAALEAYDRAFSQVPRKEPL